ncbi:hypothetical protein Unana1_03632 [Umbelopsis nana]
MDPHNNTNDKFTKSHIDSSSTTAQDHANVNPSRIETISEKTVIINHIDQEKGIKHPVLPQTPTTESSSTTKIVSDDSVEDLSEGWSNPGWLTVIALFLVNFSLFGVVFSWGILQNVFANELWQIYLSEGLLFGIGASLVWNASVSLPAQWFSKKRALATGLGVCGTGFGGLTISPITQILVEHTGYRLTLRYLAIICFVMLITGCALARARWPPTGFKSITFIDRSLLTTDFIIFMSYGFLVIFCYLTPFYLLPLYGATIGVDSSQISVIIGITSGCNAISRIILGFVADKFGRINATVAVTFLAGFFMMVVWVEAKSLASLYVFGVLYGLTGGGFISLFPAVTAELVPVQKLQQGVSLAFFSMLTGGIIGQPISSLINEYAGFTAAIEFAGATTIASSFVLMCLRQRRSHGKILCKV